MKSPSSHKARPAGVVRSSARDSVEQWLEVFTSVLAVPAVERQRIRDELEDHLRTRVEDLMILGETEHEAVQKAVRELGETAELAQRFKEATTQPRRSKVMQSILLAVAGAGLAVGAVTLTGTPAAPAPNQRDAVVQAAQDEIKTLGVDLPAGSLEAALTTVAEVTETLASLSQRGLIMFARAIPPSLTGQHAASSMGFAFLTRRSGTFPLPSARERTGNSAARRQKAFLLPGRHRLAATFQLKPWHVA